MKKSVRQNALEILLKMQRNNAYSNLALDAKLNETKEKNSDSAFLTALVYGTLERLITIDYNLSLYLKQPLKKLKPEVLWTLRLGTYQLIYMDKVPQSAAVNESVQLVKNNKSAFASGLVNAVLRNISKNGIKYPDTCDEVYNMSVRFSFPQWIVKLWMDSYGKETAYGMLECMAKKAPLYIRVNTLKCSVDELAEKLQAENVEVKRVTNVENALELVNPGAVEKLQAYKDGLFHVQDLSSQLCCAALSPKAGERVLDMCAAPGGKSFTLCEMMENEGELLSFDIYASRLSLIESGAKRLGIKNIKVAENDASKFNEELEKADKVLCDVPCSGLGIIRRKPEIRYKNPLDIDKLPSIQYDILCSCAKYVKTGGKLLYSTCSVNPAENAEICEKFLKEHKQFKAVEPLENLDNRYLSDKFLTLMPHLNGTDGFFIATFIRTE